MSANGEVTASEKSAVLKPSDNHNRSWAGGPSRKDSGGQYKRSQLLRYPLPALEARVWLLILFVWVLSLSILSDCFSCPELPVEDFPDDSVVRSACQCRDTG